MLNLLDFAEDLSKWKVFEEIEMHPSKVRAALLSLVSTIEEAIVLLVKLLVTLVKVYYLIVNLWRKVIRLDLGSKCF